MKTPSFATLAATVVFAASTFAPLQRLQAQQATAGQPLAKEAVLCSLTTKLDSKKSKVGDPVVAKTLNPLTLNDGTVEALPPKTPPRPERAWARAARKRLLRREAASGA